MTQTPPPPNTEHTLGRIPESFYKFHGELTISQALHPSVKAVPGYLGLEFRRKAGCVEVVLLRTPPQPLTAG